MPLLIGFPMNGSKQGSEAVIDGLDTKLAGWQIYELELLGKPSIVSEYCLFCGRPATNQHHIIQKGMGGSKHEKLIPTVSVCGMGNTSGCHGEFHAKRLHIRWVEDHYEYLHTTTPTKDLEALEMDGWKRLPFELFVTQVLYFGK